MQTGTRRASEVGISGLFFFFASRQNVPTAKQYNAPLWTHRWASFNRCPRPQSPSPRRGSECRRHPGNVPHAPPAHPCTPRGRAVLTLPQALVLPEFLEPRPHGILQHVPLGEASSLGTVACDSPPLSSPGPCDVPVAGPPAPAIRSKLRESGDPRVCRPCHRRVESGGARGSAFAGGCDAARRACCGGLGGPGHLPATLPRPSAPRARERDVGADELCPQPVLSSFPPPSSLPWTQALAWGGGIRVSGTPSKGDPGDVRPEESP